MRLSLVSKISIWARFETARVQIRNAHQKQIRQDCRRNTLKYRLEKSNIHMIEHRMEHATQYAQSCFLLFDFLHLSFFHTFCHTHVTCREHTVTGYLMFVSFFICPTSSCIFLTQVYGKFFLMAYVYQILKHSFLISVVTKVKLKAWQTCVQNLQKFVKTFIDIFLFL